MNYSRLDRRTFHGMALAALSGMSAGVLLADDIDDDDDRRPHTDMPRPKPYVEAHRRERHVCKGLNSCKGHGRTGLNECAGTGACATVPHIPCATRNECKAMGGCGLRPGENDCKGKGVGEIPLREDAWMRARERFVARMRQAGRHFGTPPLSDDERYALERAEMKEELDDFHKQAREQFKKQWEEEQRKKKEEEERKKKEEEEEEERKKKEQEQSQDDESQDDDD